METTLYPNNTSTTTTSSSSTMSSSRDLLKRKMTLDLESNTTSVIKKARFPGNSLQTPVFTKTEVLSSPDFHKLNLASPELERLILHPNSFTPSNTFFPKTVTEEQENYAKGFENALAQLQSQNQLNQSNYGNGVVIQQNQQTSSQQLLQQQVQQVQNYSSNNSINSDEDEDSNSEDSDSNSMTSSSTSYTTNGYLRPPPEYGIVVKEEPGAQVVPDHLQQSVGNHGNNTGGGAPTTPIDMANQEKIKLERKRQRNRVAASKCRKRKLERISKLEDKVKQIKAENTELISVSNKLRDSVNELKREVMRHVELGCQIMVSGQGF